jgi:hypothetical protein
VGSQSVTDFSKAKKDRIRDLIKEYSPETAKGKGMAAEIGAAAVGTLAKGPTNEFLQAISSPSVETALGLIITLADRLREDPSGLYEEIGVTAPEPLGFVSAFLTRAHTDRLSANQAETESAFAAKDAIPKTIIDVVSRAFPHEKEPVEINRKKFAQAFQKVEQKEIVKAFMRNVAAGLIDQVLDATRGRFSPGVMAELKRRIREDYVPEFVEQLMQRKRPKT